MIYAWSPNQNGEPYNQDGSAVWESATLFESGDNYYKDVSVKLNTNSGKAQID